MGREQGKIPNEQPLKLNVFYSSFCNGVLRSCPKSSALNHGKKTVYKIFFVPALCRDDGCLSSVYTNNMQKEDCTEGWVRILSLIPSIRNQYHHISSFKIVNRLQGHSGYYFYKKCKIFPDCRNHPTLVSNACATNTHFGPIINANGK